ncbi:MAG: hypothetical protein ACOY3O_05550 [Thermodesulfobacteriota bacterium]
MKQVQTKKIIILIAIIAFASIIYMLFLYKDPRLIEVSRLVNNLTGVDVYGVSGDSDIGISAIIKPNNGLPVGVEGVVPESFDSHGSIYVFMVGNYYVSVFNSDGDFPAYSSIDISKPLSEGGILNNPIMSMQEIESRFQELEDAFFKIPHCPEFRETVSADGAKFKSCIFKRKNECLSSGKTGYKCMLEGINQWGRL